MKNSPFAPLLAITLLATTAACGGAAESSDAMSGDAAFVAEPAKYAPAYGGYCAWAIGANDALAPGDPNVYKIVDDKLYLNFNEDVATKWNADIPGFIASADANYPTHAPDEHFQD